MYISKWANRSKCIFFNEEDIEEVLFEGFKDADEETFCDTFNEKIEKTPYPKFHVVAEDSKGESS